MAHCKRRCRLSVLLLLAMPLACWSQTQSSFSGGWQQDNDRSLPKRSSNVTLHIEHHDPELTITTSISHQSHKGGQADKAGRAIQKYTTEGTVSKSTGADGDEFFTSVTWKGASLVFSIEEHEGGRILRSVERWLLVENGKSLQRTRERPGREKQILFYRLQENASE